MLVEKVPALSSPGARLLQFKYVHRNQGMGSRRVRLELALESRRVMPALDVESSSSVQRAVGRSTCPERLALLLDSARRSVRTLHPRLAVIAPAVHQVGSASCARTAVRVPRWMKGVEHADGLFR